MSEARSRELKGGDSHMRRLRTAVVLSVVLALLLALSAVPTTAADNRVYVRDVQITTNPRYDRDPSLLRANDNTYWLFFARGRDARGIRDNQGYNPDLDYYDVYYKIAPSIPGLQKAKETKIPLVSPDNAQRDISALQSVDGTVWVFVSTGLGVGTDRSIYYYTYDGTWHGPVAIPKTDYAAHVSAVQKNGKIWVFYDIGYTLYVTSYNEAIPSWSAPVLVTDNATIARAIVDDGEFYVVWTNVSGTGIYLSTSADGTVWSSTENPVASWPSQGATNWDPVLMKATDNNNDHDNSSAADKGKDVFRLFWAPDAGAEGQFIATSTSADPANVSSWSPPVRMTTSSSGANSWWDFWPQPYAKGVQYLLYASERNATATKRIDGNIWMMQLRPRQ
jgi:hypothetical protein